MCESRLCSHPQSFLLLEEVVPQPTDLPETESKDCMVQVQDLKCYWDKVRTFYPLRQPKLQRIVRLGNLIHVTLFTHEADSKCFT